MVSPPRLATGFAAYDPAIWIDGVVLNRVGSDRHEEILRAALAAPGCRCSALCGATARSRLRPGISALSLPPNRPRARAGTVGR
jgi:cobyrinic acid a,c-diamide synthase